MMGAQTGGVTRALVKDPNGNTMVRETLAPNTAPPSPEGDFGFYSLSFPMSVNGTFQFGITKLLGGFGQMFQTYGSVAHLPPPHGETF